MKQTHRPTHKRRGFTIVELVIVIAVIGILAMVLVPTFGNVINNAKDSAAKQDAKNAYTEYMVGAAANGNVASYYVYEADTTRFVAIANGSVLGVYETQDAALAAMVSDPTEELVDTGDGKLFAYGGAAEDSDIKYVNTISELNHALLAGGKIHISSAITQWVLTEDVVIPEGTVLSFDNDIEIITNGYKLELNNATFTVNHEVTLDGTITVGAGDSVINGSGTIVRKSSKTMLNCQTAGSSLTISGVTLDGGIDVTSTKTAIVMIRNGAEVNVINNAVVQNSKSSKDGSAAFNVGLGTLNLDGAVIRNNKLTASKGGAIYIRDGAVVNVRNTEVYNNIGDCGAFIGEDNQQGGCTVNIYSGTNVYNNTSTNAGHSGVIYLRKTSVVNIYGGTFSDNSGVYSQDTGNATLNIMGGTFNGGSFGGNNSSSIINLSGNAQITANGTELVFANGNASGLTDDIVFITGALTDGANITLNAETIAHILSRTDGYIAKGSNYTITESDAAKFHCAGYTFKLDSVNNTIIVETN